MFFLNKNLGVSLFRKKACSMAKKNTTKPACHSCHKTNQPFEKNPQDRLAPWPWLLPVPRCQKDKNHVEHPLPRGGLVVLVGRIF